VERHDFCASLPTVARLHVYVSMYNVSIIHVDAVEHVGMKLFSALARWLVTLSEPHFPSSYICRYNPRSRLPLNPATASTVTSIPTSIADFIQTSPFRLRHGKNCQTSPVLIGISTYNNTEVKCPNFIDPPDSGVSGGVLVGCAGARAAVSGVRLALQVGRSGCRELGCESVLTDFGLEELVSRAYVDGFLVLTLSFCLEHSGDWKRLFFCMALAHDLRGRPHL